MNGPDWLDVDRFDVAARGNPHATLEERRARLRNLLRDRFKLVLHSETRELPILALVLARADGRLGPHLRPSAIDCDEYMRIKKPLPPPQSATAARPCRMMMVAGGGLRGGAMKLPALVATLSANVGRVVVDRTGLTGSYDFELQWSRDPAADASAPSIFTALQDQLGLKLEPARGPVDVLVVDHVERPEAD